MERQPLSAVLADRLAAMIITDGIYKPGEQLPTERELSESLGASRTSIREAAKLLEARGLLEVRHGIGTFVAASPGVTRDPLNIVSSSDTVTVLEDWYRVRMILEGAAMEMVAQCASDDDLRRIREIMEEEERMIDEPIDSDFMTADQLFHCELSRATHNIIMERLIPSLHASVYYDMVKSLYDKLRPRYNRNAIENHRRIMSLLEARDGNGAKIAMHYHMLIAIEDVRSIRGELAGEF